ncbi:MAG: hypothetical protein QOK40_2043 [Miltoncostaeaceae bacterium]|jgi:hypothetical protein|nr:hypothetical protein [Miltoncostaeaceae bacterium]
MIVEAHGGTIGVQGGEGRDATFRVELPLPASAQAGAPIRRKGLLGSGVRSGACRSEARPDGQG